MTADLIVLWHWALLLSGYPAIDPPPVIRVPHVWLVQHACSGKECKVWGWYDEGDSVYIDDRLNIDSQIHASVVVHEYVHYLQHASGKFVEGCVQSIAMERQAYQVQAAYLLANGIYYPVGSAMHGAGCE